MTISTFEQFNDETLVCAKVQQYFMGITPWLDDQVIDCLKQWFYLHQDQPDLLLDDGLALNFVKMTLKPVIKKECQALLKSLKQTLVLQPNSLYVVCFDKGLVKMGMTTTGHRLTDYLTDRKNLGRIRQIYTLSNFDLERQPLWQYERQALEIANQVCQPAYHLSFKETKRFDRLYEWFEYQEQDLQRLMIYLPELKEKEWHQDLLLIYTKLMDLIEV